MAEDEADVEMKDVQAADAMDIDTQPVPSIENEPKNNEDVDEEDEPDAASDGDDADNSGRPVSNAQYKELKRITDVLTNLKIKDQYPSTLFKRLPNKRLLPDYYNIIKEPSAISTLKGKIQRKQYTGIPEFVRDFARIVHNAQVFNRPNSAPVRDVLRLDAVFKEEMQKLVEAGIVKAEETVFPDLGVIPDATPEPDPVSEDDEDGDEEQDEDDEEDGDESDDDRRKKRGRRGRISIGGKKQDKDDDEGDDKAADTDPKRRGRPPKVDTPMEARIKAILKGLRKYRNDQGQVLIYDFEKLPDKAEHPDYYTVIPHPVALDGIKKKAKRKKYDTVDQFMKDITTMFNNAMLYNEDGSEINTSARELLEEAKKLAQIEKDKPDTEYLMQDGRLPLPYINHNGKVWRVGDWVHIQNVNDVTKPIPAQIYRTWEDSDKRKWINACWYYRPEQTVHQYEKHFFPSEVVKTGQYRDHPIEEVLEKCFVMFFTRFGKGRPRGMDPSEEVYVCESRYNEEKFKFNKIKTWASCLPDEVRDKDYEMDLFDVPKKVKKIPSPLTYLIDKDAKEDQDVPQPVWGALNAPPKQGAIYKRPRDENQSPPPEPTPPPPTPPPVIRQPSANHLSLQSHPQPGLQRQGSLAGLGPGQLARPSPSAPPQTPYQGTSLTPGSQYTRPQYQPQGQQTPYNGGAKAFIQPGLIMPPSQQTPLQPGAYGALHPGSYQPPNIAQNNQNYTVSTPLTPQGQGAQQGALPISGYGPSYGGREPTAYVFHDRVNGELQQAVPDCYQQNDAGQIIFFPHPPVAPRPMITDEVDPRGRGQPLQHTERYLAKMEEIKAKRLARLRELKAKHVAKMNSNPINVRSQEARDGKKASMKAEDLQESGRKKRAPRFPGDEDGLTDQEANARYRAIVKAEDDAAPYKIQDFWTGHYLDDYDSGLPPFK